MAGIIDLPVDSARRLDSRWWWPTVPAGYYSFEDGVTEFIARDQFGEIVLELDQTPDVNDSYFSVEDTEFTFGALLIPAYANVRLYLSPTTTALYANRTLTYEANFTPDGEDKFGLLVGQLIFSGSIVEPPVVVL